MIEFKVQWDIFEVTFEVPENHQHTQERLFFSMQSLRRIQVNLIIMLSLGSMETDHVLSENIL